MALLSAAEFLPMCPCAAASLIAAPEESLLQTIWASADDMLRQQHWGMFGYAELALE